MEELKQEIADKTKEVSFYLWQSLITVNALLASILIALIAIKHLPTILNLLAILGLILSTSSCVLLILNFMNIKEVYRIIANQIGKGDVPNNTQIKNHLDFTEEKYNQNQSNEKRAIYSTVIAWIILAIIIIFGFMPSMLPITLPK